MSYNPNVRTIYEYSNEPTGFPDRVSANISFDEGSRTLTVAPVGDSFDYYVQGVKYTWLDPATSTITDTEGLWYFYFDGYNLQNTQTFSTTIITETAYVAVLYWDAANNKAVYFGEERHGLTMDGQTHLYLHNSVGATFISGFALDDFQADGTGNAAADGYFSVANGIFHDEDIRYSITNGSPQTLYPVSNLPVFYRDGASGNWRKKDADVFPIIYSGTAGYTGANGRLPYNQWTGSVWQLTQLASGNFVLVHVVATNDVNNPIIAIQGIKEYATIGDARLGATTEYASLSGLPFAEIVVIGSVIFQTATTYTNPIKGRIRTTDTGANYVDLRKLSSLPSNQISDHGNLSGLNDPDHPASAILASTVNFAGLLSSSDTTVQLALDTLDNITISNLSPLTTKGDLLTRDASSHVRLPVGPDGYVLTADSLATEGIKWAVSGGGGGGTPAGSTGAIQFNNAGSFAADTANLFWDDSNNRLGIGTNTPGYTLEVKSGSTGFAFNASTQALGTTLGTTGGLGILAEAPGSATGPSLYLGASARGDLDKNVVKFSVGATEYMRIDGDFAGHTLGYVGIGTNTPATKLDVFGGGRFVVSSGLDAVSVTNNIDSTFALRVVGSGQVRLKTDVAGRWISIADGAGTTDNVVFRNARVGIGTTNPSFPLEVKSGSAGFAFDPADQAFGTTFGTGGNLTILAEDPNSSTGAVIYLGGSGRGDLDKNVVKFLIGTTEYMRVDGDFTGHTIGYVGIGTNTPAAKLDVNSTHTSASTPFARFSNPSATGQIPLEFHVNGTVRAKIRANATGELVFVSNGGSHFFYTGGDFGTGTERFQIKNSGEAVFNDTSNDYDLRAKGTSDANLLLVDAGNNRVGIGTNAPATKLHVAGESTFGGSVVLPTVTVSSNTTLDSTHYTVRADATGGAFTISLPACSGCTGRVYVIKKIDNSANTVTVDPNLSETIDGSGTIGIGSQYDSFVLQSNGTSWDIL